MAVRTYNLNQFFQHTFQAGNQAGAVNLMMEVCMEWIKSGRPEDLIRAARHYERASQIIISQQVKCSH